MASTNPIHMDQTVQHVDVRLYFGKDENREHLLDNISEALQAHASLASMISAYELVGDGFGRLVPGDKPLA